MLIPKGGTKEKTQAALKAVQEILGTGAGEWTVTALKNTIEVLVRPGTFTRGELLWPLRVALTGERESPDVFDVAWALGPEKTLERLQQALTTVAKA